MQANLALELLELYPEILLSFDETCFELDFGHGWYSIIETLCSLLAEMNRREGQHPTYLQSVREKLGTVRILVSGRTPEAHAWITFAEQHSARTCELCGGNGRLLFTEGWQRVRCETHLSYRITDDLKCTWSKKNVSIVKKIDKEAQASCGSCQYPSSIAKLVSTLPDIIFSFSP